MEWQDLFSFKSKRKIQVSSAAVVIGDLRVNSLFDLFQMIHMECQYLFSLRNK